MKEIRTIRNKDILLLNDVYFIMQEIVSLEKRRAWQRERMTNVTQHFSAGIGGGSAPKGIDATLAKLYELEDGINGMIGEYAEKLKRAQSVLNAIHDEKMRVFVTMMYLDNIPGREVRERLNMTRRGFDRAREAVEQAESMESVKWSDNHYFYCDNVKL